MDAAARERFDSLEAALNNLVTSITSYNPSIAAAETLLQADDDLSGTLDDLVIHQRNHQLIQKLRVVADSLDARIKSTLSQLVDTRNTLKKSTPVTLPVKDLSLNPVQADQLLLFAQRLARHTVPPTYREPTEPLFKCVDKATDSLPNRKGEIHPEITTGHSTEGKAIADLAPEIIAWLEPPSNHVIFKPWPADEVVHKGALSRIEQAWEQGVDPMPADIATESEVKEDED